MTVTDESWMDALPPDVAARLRRQQSDKVAARARALPALELIVNAIRNGEDTGQGSRLVRFLASLYNGDAYPFELPELRGLDTPLASACLLVLDYDRWGESEVHRWGVIEREELIGYMTRAGLIDAFEARMIGRGLYREKFPKGHCDADARRYV